MTTVQALKQWLVVVHWKRAGSFQVRSLEPRFSNTLCMKLGSEVQGLGSQDAGRLKLDLKPVVEIRR